MIPGVVDFAVRRKLLVLEIGLLLLVWGGYSFHRLPVEAYPDVANTYVQVITQWPGHAAEEIEHQVTMPVEAGLNGLGHLEHLRSLSLFGLSAVTLILDDDADNYVARQQVLEKLSGVDLPPHVSAQLSPDYSPLGQIYWYTLTSTNPQFGLTELKALQNGYLERQFKSVPNIVELSGFGGLTREYQVRIDPNKLLFYGLNIRQVEQELAVSNDNVGGRSIERGEQAFNIRAVALANTADDIAEVALTTRNGRTVRVRDVADVVQGAKIRLGKIGKTIHRENGQIIDDDDLVEGIVLMRKDAPSDETIAACLPGVTGAEFLPHSDEGTIWARGTLPSSVAPTEAMRLVRQARKVFAKYPEVTTVTSQVGRPDDGTDATGFFNTEYFIDLKPRDQWRHPFWTKVDLISSMSAYLRKQIPGVVWNFSQPIQDNLEEAAIGVKGQHAVKLFGPDLKLLEEKGEQIVKVMDQIRGVSDPGLLRLVGQPNVDLTIDRARPTDLASTSVTFKRSCKSQLEGRP